MCIRNPGDATHQVMDRRTPAQRLDQSMKALREQALLYFQGAQYAAIRDKVYMGDDVRQTPLSILSLQTTPTDAEKKALDARQQYLSTVYAPREESLYKEYAPFALPIRQMDRAASLSLLVELYVGNISYGEYARKRIELATNTFPAMHRREEEVRTMAVQQAQAQAELDVQRVIASSQAMRAFQNYLIGQQLINQQLRRTLNAPFTCIRNGNVTHCY